MSYLFQGQRVNESVVLFTKQHPLVLLRPALIMAAAAILPVLVFTVTNSNFLTGWTVFAALVFCFAYGWIKWHDWENTLFLLTDERLVVLRQKGVFNRELTECGLQSIQQVSHEVRGLLNTLFGFGTILIQTGGSSIEPLAIPHMPDPYEIQQELQRIAAGEGLAEDGWSDQE